MQKLIEQVAGKLRAASWEDRKPGMGAMDVVYVDDAIGEITAAIRHHKSAQQEKLRSVREKLALIKQRCGTEMDYGSGSDAVQNGYILSGEAIALLDTLIEQPTEGNSNE